MIRPFTCVCVLLAAASGLYLYQSKHRVQLLDRQIEGVVAQTQAARARSGVLRAEWTLMSDPERLAQLADKFMQLKTVTPGQFTTMAELDNRLPPIHVPDAKAPDAAPEPQPEPMALAPEAPQAPTTPPPVAVAAKPAEPKPAPVKLAAERPKPEPTKAEAAKADHKPAHDAITQVASAAVSAPGSRVGGTSLVTRVSAAVPVPRPVPLAAFAQSSGGFSSSTPVHEAHAPRPPAPAPFIGSALGMAHSTLGAPVPVSAALPAPVPYNQPNGN